MPLSAGSSSSAFESLKNSTTIIDTRSTVPLSEPLRTDQFELKSSAPSSVSDLKMTQNNSGDIIPLDTPNTNVTPNDNATQTEQMKLPISSVSVPITVAPEIDYSLVETIESMISDPDSPLGKYINSNNLVVNMAHLLELRDIAYRIFEGTYSLMESTEYLRYLGSGSFPGALKTETETDIDIIRCFYMSFFRWNINLLTSLRVLCDKLYFKGESQDIDKILDSFSESWYHVYGNFNQDSNFSLFSSANGVYLVSYSLILLNTDLHTVELEKKKKINKSNYVRNTQSALAQNKIRSPTSAKMLSELKSFYDDLLHKELPIHIKNAHTNSNYNILGNMNHSRQTSIYSSTSSMMPQSRTAGSVRNASLNGSNTTPNKLPMVQKKPSLYGFTGALANQKKIKRVSSVESRLSNTRNSIISRSSALTNDSMIQRYDNSIYTNITSGDEPNLSDLIEEEGETQLELEGPPWMKEGLLNVLIPEGVLAELNNSGTNEDGSLLSISNTLGGIFVKRFKPKWQHLFAVISKGELRIFEFDTTNPAHKSSAQANWMDQANCIATINLCSTLAHTLANNTRFVKSAEASYGKPFTNHSKKRTGFETYWCLNLPVTRATKLSATNRILFYAGSAEVAQEYVDSCNFWASRSSAIPPDELISSMEYGWSDKLVSILDNTSDSEEELTKYLSSLTVSKWVPLIHALIPSSLPMREQLVELKKHHQMLQSLIDSHSKLALHEEVFFKVYQKASSSSSSSFNLFARKSSTNATVSKNTKMIRLNFANRKNYLQNELIRFSKYISILHKAIEMQRQLIQEEEQLQYQDAETGE